MSTVIDLSTLTNEQGFVIRGGVAGEIVGCSVSSAGDVNGDGIADLIVGALGSNQGGTAAGKAYVVFGRASGLADIDLANLAPSQGFAIQGDVSFDRAGWSVSSAGDMNGDGFADVIVGAPFATVGGESNAGKAYVIFGHAGAFGSIDLTSLGTRGFVIQGAVANDNAGISVSSAGDINGDGFADVIVGASGADDGGAYSGEAYVIFGRARGLADIDLSLMVKEGFVIRGDEAADETGASVSSAGDVNGDGFDDLIVGTRDGGGGTTDPGKAYVIFGHRGAFGELTVSNSGYRPVIDLTALAASQGFCIQGDSSYDRAGVSVSSAGDVNGDGFADLIVGAPYGDDRGLDSGEAYVVFGHAGAFGTVDLANLGTQGFVIRGDTTPFASGDWAGRSVSSAGDVNGDGFADLLVGAPGGDNGGTDAGEAYVIFGHAGVFSDIDLAHIAPGQGFVIQGDAEDDGAGNSVAAAGDVNGDGFADLIVGARGGDDRGSNAGEAYVIYGHGPAAPILRHGTAVADTIVGAEANDTLYGQGGNELIEGGEGLDRIYGGSGDDLLNGGDGNDVLIGGADNDTMRGGAGDDLFYVDAAGDAVIETASAGADIVRAQMDYTLTDNVEELFIGGAARNGSGNALANTLHGSGSNNVLLGLGGDDIIRGGGGRDTIDGGIGADLIDGGVGKDTLTGGAGRDVFQFRDGDFGANRSLADVITDFSHADAEKIHLSLVDANVNAGGNQAFAFIGSGAFTGVAGQLHYAQAGGNTYVEGDTDGDGMADFMIALTGLHSLVGGDFVL